MRSALELVTTAYVIVSGVVMGQQQMLYTMVWHALK